ncbi:MAG: ATP-binding cassette domain-containing protein, partial [Lactococcus lactis]|nr:ATP-binding cassette domain-containing protein [Lactococcus lactis]
HPHSLSGGEKQRVAIASALLSGKEILLFDEPTSGLDYLHMKEVSQLLQSLKNEPVIVLVISHDEEFLQTTCQTIVSLKNGKLVEVVEREGNNI